METPNREPQEYSRKRIGIDLPGPSIPYRFLLFSWGSHLDPSKHLPKLDARQGGDRLLRRKEMSFGLEGLRGFRGLGFVGFRGFMGFIGFTVMRFGGHLTREGLVDSRQHRV